MTIVNSIPVGVQTTLLQNVEYAVPSMSVWVQTTRALQSSAEGIGGAYNAFTSSILTGISVKCTTGDAVVTLRKNGVS